MNKHEESTFKTALRDSVPVIFGYIPLGMAFGVLFSNLGYDWIYAGLMGLVIFAGAAQFMAIGLLAAQADLLSVLVSTLILNSRHIFYGVSLIEKYTHSFFTRVYLAFGLTDETYSLVTSSGRTTPGDSYFLYVTALNHAYWVAGCTLGAFMGNRLNLSIPGLEFALVALFVVLTIEQFKRVRSIGLLGAAFATALISLIWIREYMLLVSILMSCVILASYGKINRWLLPTT
ncbi:MAG: AzlC family ABC transporter permease [Oligoflexales bacterium]